MTRGVSRGAFACVPSQATAFLSEGSTAAGTGAAYPLSRACLSRFASLSRLLAQAAARPELRLEPSVRDGGHAELVPRLIGQVVLQGNLQSLAGREDPQWGGSLLGGRFGWVIGAGWARLHDGALAAGALSGAAVGRLLLPAEHERRLRAGMEGEGHDRGIPQRAGSGLVTRTAVSRRDERGETRRQRWIEAGRVWHLRCGADEGRLELDGAAVGHDRSNALDPAEETGRIRGLFCLLVAQLVCLQT